MQTRHFCPSPNQSQRWPIKIRRNPTVVHLSPSNRFSYSVLVIHTPQLLSFDILNSCKNKNNNMAMVYSQLCNPPSRLEGDVIGNRQKKFQPSNEKEQRRGGLSHNITRVTDTMQLEKDLLMNTCRQESTSHLLNQAHRPRDRGNH